MVHVATRAAVLEFLEGQPAFVRARCGLAVHAIAAPGPTLVAFGEREGVPIHPVDIAREIAPLRDLGALWRLWRVLRGLRPLIVDAHSPKGGLLGMAAATLARVPVRVYHLHGLRFLTATGARRLVLRWSERVSCALADRVLSVSDSVRAIAVSERLCRDGKIAVLLDGSINGVDATRFAPSEAVRSRAREQLGIGPDDVCVGFVGRLARDKGIAELAAAWALLRERDARLRLVVAGEPDGTDPLPRAVLDRLRQDSRVSFTGWVQDPVPLYAATDVVALPTYREGFTTVALEAAAMQRPIVASAVAGCVDAVQDGVTGTLVPARDAAALARALERYASDPALRAAHGEAGRRRVLSLYRPERMWEAIAEEYERLLATRGHEVHAAARAPASVRRVPHP